MTVPMKRNGRPSKRRSLKSVSRSQTILVPNWLERRIAEIAKWENRSHPDVTRMLMLLGLEVYDVVVARLAGKVLVPEGQRALAGTETLIAAIGRAELVEQAAVELMKRNAEWLVEREDSLAQ
jgi:hypothetical protein